LTISSSPRPLLLSFFSTQRSKRVLQNGTILCVERTEKETGVMGTFHIWSLTCGEYLVDDWLHVRHHTILLDLVGV
jgi:hypothetical protein